MPRLKIISPFKPGQQVLGLKLIRRYRAVTDGSRGGTYKYPRWQWDVICVDCGQERSIAEGALERGATKSCRSCGQKERFARDGALQYRHGHALSGKKSPEYQTWRGIKQRCEDLANPNYGGRGIKMAPQWAASFEQFLKDVGPKPPGKYASGRSIYTLDRINNDGDYEPGNVRWTTYKVQANNRRKAPPKPRTIYTHCAHKHPLTSENTYWTKNGFQQCRTCNRLRKRRYDAAKKASGKNTT